MAKISKEWLEDLVVTDSSLLDKVQDDGYDDYYEAYKIYENTPLEEDVDDDFYVSFEDIDDSDEPCEDCVTCKWCGDQVDKSEAKYEVDMGWLCDNCIEAIRSRGEPLTLRMGEACEGQDCAKEECKDGVCECKSGNVYKDARRQLEALEDEVECQECGELVSKSNCKQNENGDWVCNECLGTVVEDFEISEDELFRD